MPTHAALSNLYATETTARLNGVLHRHTSERTLLSGSELERNERHSTLILAELHERAHREDTRLQVVGAAGHGPYAELALVKNHGK